MKKYSLAALVAAGVLAGGMSTGASAADLGGNCCADLEERIAELEATTARKGNRKVSLTIGGWVSQQVMYWNDGGEDNVYITDTGSVSIGTHVRFTGQAQIAPGWTAGYVLKLEVMGNDSLGVTQNNDNGGNVFAGTQGRTDTISVESSYWFVKSDQYGKLSVGTQSSAADNQAILPDGSGTLVVANYVLYDARAFFLRNNSGNLTGHQWLGLAACAPVGGAVAGDCDGYPYASVRYDTPVFGGFSASASWGADDIWAVSLRYAGEFSGFKIAAAAAYNHTSDENGPFNPNSSIFDPTGDGAALQPDGTIFGNGFEASAWQVGGYLEHVPTGLWVYGAYAKENYDVDDGKVGPAVDGDMWYIKAGLRQRFSPLGHTIFYGEYGKDEDKLARGSELERYGLGVVQEVDAAAMSVWLSWRHYEADLGLAAGTGTDDGTGIEDLDIVKAGALINF